MFFQNRPKLLIGMDDQSCIHSIHLCAFPMIICLCHSTKQTEHDGHRTGLKMINVFRWTLPCRIKPHTSSSSSWNVLEDAILRQIHSEHSLFKAINLENFVFKKELQSENGHWVDKAGKVRVIRLIGCMGDLSISPYGDVFYNKGFEVSLLLLGYSSSNIFWKDDKWSCAQAKNVLEHIL